MKLPDSHLVLHAVAVKKHGTLDEIAGISGLDAAAVEAALQAAAGSGRVIESQGRYALTPAAQMALQSAYARHYDALRADEGFMTAYGDFEKVNVDLKQVITRWQTMTLAGEQVPNDHSDTDYDESVIDELGKLHERAEGIFKRLAAALPRLAIYGDKLEAALDRAEDGAHEWVSDARRESYHTVWFELHEDLLRITGRQREE